MSAKCGLWYELKVLKTCIPRNTEIFILALMVNGSENRTYWYHDGGAKEKATEYYYKFWEKKHEISIETYEHMNETYWNIKKNICICFV